MRCSPPSEHEMDICSISICTSELAKHADILGITIPNFEIPEGLDGLIKIQIDENGVEFHTKPFYQEIHMDAEGITVPAPRWTVK